MVKLKQMVWVVTIIAGLSFCCFSIGFAGEQCSDRDEIFEFLESIPGMTVNELTDDPYCRKQKIKTVIMIHWVQ